MTPTPLAFEDEGSGTALLLIHGFPHDRRLWIPQLSALSSSMRVIVPDLRGFGVSPAATTTVTMDEHADDLKLLLQRRGIRQAVVAGLSMGGYVALAFMARYPAMVRGLVLCNTRATPDGAEERERREATARKVLEHGVADLAEAMLPKMLTPGTLSTRPELASTIRGMMAGQPTAGVVSGLRGMAKRPDRTPMLPGIAVPTLIISGSKDEAVAPAESEAMARAIPGSKLTVFPDVAHLSNVEAPEAFNALLRDFVVSTVPRMAATAD